MVFKEKNNSDKQHNSITEGNSGVVINEKRRLSQMTAPLFLCGVMVIASQCLRYYYSASFILWIIVAILSVGSGVLLIRKNIPHKYAWLPLIFVLAFGFGVARDAMAPDNPFDEVEEASLTLRITDYPFDDGEQCTFTGKVLASDGKALSDPVKINVIVDTGLNLKYGNQLYVSGSFLRSTVLNPGGFDYSSYQENQGLYGTFSALYGGEVIVYDANAGNPVMRVIYWVRDRFEQSLNRLDDDKQSIIRGIFLGDTSGLSYTDSDILTKSGIRHCFAVSGLHVGYILLFLNALAGMLSWGPKRRISVICGCLFFYSAITGFAPSVMRASLMCVMILLAELFGRERNGFNGIGAAAIVLFIINPDVVYQSGFILSFGAMFSILFFMPWLQRCVPVSFPGKDGLLVTVAAQIGMLPLLAYQFHVVSIISFFISTVCCLAVGAIVILCFGALLLAIIVPGVAYLLLLPAGLLGKLVLTAAGYCVNLPFAYLYRGHFPVLWLVAVYGLLIAVVVAKPLRKRNILSLVLCAGIIMTLFIPSALSDDDGEITFLAVGEADACYIRTPSGKNILIDAGDPKEGSVYQYTIRPFLLYKGVTEIDAIILSHHDDDHDGALTYILEDFPVKQFIVAEQFLNDYRSILGTAAITTASSGDKIDFGDEIIADVLWPSADFTGEDNESSLCLRLSYDTLSVLFCGDIEGDGLDGLREWEDALDSDIIKIPHHGSKYSYDEELYQFVSPEYAIISVGKNSYGHPGEEVTDYMDDNNITCFRTDLNGAVTFSIKDGTYSVETYLGSD